MNRLAIIVPFRDRQAHLEKFLPAMERHLEGTQIDYQVWVIEQANNELFNKGSLMNAGFDLTKNSFDYFCFHDVDLLPESSACDYSYTNSVAHLSTYVEQFRYKKQKPFTFIGGVALFSKEAFIEINGYSNEYFHWGAEDSDVYWRTQLRDFTVEHRPGRYASLPHKKNHSWIPGEVKHPWATKNIRRFRNLKKRYKETGEENTQNNGLNSVEYVVMGKKKISERYTRVAVDFYDVGVEEVEELLEKTQEAAPQKINEFAPSPFAHNRERKLSKNRTFNRNRLKLKS